MIMTTTYFGHFKHYWL